MKDITFTIMTPTYNRAELLKRLYFSVLAQDRDDVEWLIVDDGSTDNTQNVVESFIKENKLCIRYIYQENSGKYKAYNNGIEHANGKLFFCVDSDDILANNVLTSIETNLNKLSSFDGVAGIISLKSDWNGNILSDNLPENKIIHLYDLSDKYKINGEFCIIYFTSVLKMFRFPDVYPEKFVGESVLYDAIDKSYKLYTVNEVMNKCEYQADGLTNQFANNMVNNPTGYKVYYKQRIDLAKSWKDRLLYMIKYNAFKNMSNDKKYDYNGKYKLLVRALGITGIVATNYYIIRYKKK